MLGEVKKIIIFLFFLLTRCEPVDKLYVLYSVNMNGKNRDMRNSLKQLFKYEPMHAGAAICFTVELPSVRYYSERLGDSSTGGVP